MGIVVERLDVEVGIRCGEVEDIVFPMVGPVLPADVPALDEHLREAVGGGEVDVLAYLLIVGTMAAVGLHLAPVNAVEFDGGIFVGVVPGVSADNHLPPHAAVLRRMYPTGVLYLTRFVEVVDEVVGLGEHVACIIAHGNGAPRCLARCLHISFHAGGIRGEPRLKHHVLVIEVEMHRGVVDAGSLVDVDVESVVGLHLQRRLHTCG